MSLGFSKAMSQTGVTSNCISPGMVRTEGVRDFLANFAAKRGWGDDIAQAEDYVKKGTGQTVKAIGEVDDLQQSAFERARGGGDPRRPHQV